MFELRFFATHFLQAHRGVSLSAEDRDGREREFLAIVEELAGEPRVLCHRDYHSRNLMVHDGRSTSSTFRMRGWDPTPTTSCRCCAIPTWTCRRRGRRSSLSVSLACHEDAGATAGFRRRFDLMAVQRNLKALGTFGFQATTRGNPVYIQSIPRHAAATRPRTQPRYPRFGCHRGVSDGLVAGALTSARPKHHR